MFQGLVAAVCLPALSALGACAGPPTSQAAEERLGERAVQLPEDDAPHQVPLEWWYYTGHLRSDLGDAWGFQVTFFKLQNGVDLYLGNFAVTDHQSQRFFFAEKAWFDAAQGDGYALDVAGWQAFGADGYDTISVAAGDYALELALSPLKHAVLHGAGGLTGSGPEAAHYYSRTRLATTGSLTKDGAAHAVSGSAWMDHEWFERQVKIEHLSWDWFAIQLDDGTELMLGISRVDGERYAEGTWIDEHGDASRLRGADFTVNALEQWQAPESGHTYPMRWKVALPAHGVQLELEPVLLDQELHGLEYTPLDYWEGEVTIRGSARGMPVRGQGYVELTGYE